MQEFIARENIKRFEEKLRHVTDEQGRATLEQLLTDERARLRQIIDALPQQHA